MHHPLCQKLFKHVLIQLHFAYHFQPLLAFRLMPQKLHFSCHISSITFCCHIFPEGLDVTSSQNLRQLHYNLKQTYKIVWSLTCFPTAA